jgi:flagellar protein FliL
MADEKLEAASEQQKPESPAKGGKKKLMLIIGGTVLALAIAGGIFFFVAGKKTAADGHKTKDAESESKSILISLDPFVLNLSEQGRFLKVTMQIELGDPALQPMVTGKIPQLRDAIITLVSSKSAESVSTPEGKFQLKDELLLRANQAVGKDVFKNLYYTEFVMQ